MNILLVAATPLETSIIREQAGIEMQGASSAPLRFGPYTLVLLHTGIGMVNAAYQLGRYLSRSKPDLAINFGIAGSFTKKFSLGDLVEIKRDTFAELGAEDGENFLNLQDMGFPLMVQKGNNIYNSIENPHTSSFQLPEVHGITVNTVHGNPESIKKSQETWPVEVETMESAAFFHAFVQESNIPFFGIRSISNYVELRDKSSWEIPKSVQAVQDFVLRQLSDYRL